MHWVKIGNMYMDLETFNTFRVESDGMVYMDNAATWSGDPDESHYMRKESPGVASFLAYLDNCCGVGKFDETTDAELEPVSEWPVYKIGDVVEVTGAHSIETTTVSSVMHRKYDGLEYVVTLKDGGKLRLLAFDIIGLAPPESVDHE